MKTALPKDVEVYSEHKIYRTKNYDLFKKIKGNREIGKSEILNFCHSLKEINLLHENPIQVTRDMKVKDGQRRLASATHINDWIYFVFVDNAPLSEIQNINYNVRKWSFLHFMESYIVMGNENYINFKKFLKKYDFPFSACLTILLHPHTLVRAREDHEGFRLGKLILEDFDESIKVAEKINEFLSFAYPTVQTSTRFYDAVLHMMIKEPAYVDRLLMKMANGKVDKIHNGLSLREYLIQFESIINHENYGGKYVRLVK